MDATSNQYPHWDVFLSFYGKDTRRNFISNLYFALDQAGILTFRDDPALEKGEQISLGLHNAIKSSNKFVVVISENYAHSSWCLDELVEILGCKRTVNQVIPVFYYVNPSDLRHQKGIFGDALELHKKRYSVDIIKKWISALAEIAELSGYHLKKDADENESDTIQEIVENVAPKSSKRLLHHDECLVGIDYVVEEIYQKLNMELNDIRAIGVCGMGGIGKTTIAKAFHNKYSTRFDINCFVENAKQYSEAGSPLLPLLKQILVDLLKRNDYKVPNVETGIRRLQQILCSKKALIVLDDFDQSGYSQFLAQVCHLFSAGSRIVITTRDVNLLNQLKVDISEVDVYMVKILGQMDSLKLFSYYAFGNPMPPESFIELSVSFVNFARGLPLALKVLGSSLRGRTCTSFWKAKLEKVRQIPENGIHRIIQLSYDELGDEMEKALFLDIAFFFVGRNKDEAVHILKSCDLYPETGIPILMERCLLTVDRFNDFQMHNLIQDMGRQLGKGRHLLWQGNAWEDLPNLEGTHKIEGLILDFTISTKRQISSQIFERLPKLRLLEIIDAHEIKGDFRNSFHELRCIRWRYCPWACLPPSFRPKKLVSLDMAFSKLKVLWKDPMPMKQLTNLSHLDLRDCFNLSRLPEQLGDMHGLKKFDASDTAIEQLPDSITLLRKLVTLRVCGCKKLKKLPEQFGNMEGLRSLDVGYTAIEQLPDSITHLKRLSWLSLIDCKKLRMLPEQFGDMKGLETFYAMSSAIEQLPDSFGGLINLETLNLNSCKNLRNLPNSISKLKFLRALDVHDCSKLDKLPEQLGSIQCLERFNASGTAIEELADSIGLLSRLQVLHLENCNYLKYLPKDLGNLQALRSLYIVQEDNIKITLPDTVKHMKLVCLSLRCNIRLWLPMILSFSYLIKLTLSDEGQNLSSTKPYSLSKLFNLRDLTLDNCGSSFPELPPNLIDLNLSNHATLRQLPDLSALKQLKKLYIQKCISLQSLPPLPPHLEELEVSECTSLQVLPDLSMLRELDILGFIECNNLKLTNLKESSLQVERDFFFSFKADVPNRNIADWFSNKSSGCTVSLDIPSSLGDNFIGVALWVLCTCKHTGKMYYVRADVTNETEGTTIDYEMTIDYMSGGEVQSIVNCISKEDISVKSGDRITISLQWLKYSTTCNGVEVFEEEKVEMCGAHVIQKTPSTPSIITVLHKYFKNSCSWDLPVFSHL